MESLIVDSKRKIILVKHKNKFFLILSSQNQEIILDSYEDNTEIQPIDSHNDAKYHNHKNTSL